MLEIPNYMIEPRPHGDASGADPGRQQLRDLRLHCPALAEVCRSSHHVARELAQCDPAASRPRVIGDGDLYVFK